MISARTVLLIICFFLTISIALLGQSNNENIFQYKKVYPSTFQGKYLVIRNWFSNKYGLTYTSDPLKDNILRYTSTVQVKNPEVKNTYIGELKYIINANQGLKN